MLMLILLCSALPRSPVATACTHGSSVDAPLEVGCVGEASSTLLLLPMLRLPLSRAAAAALVVSIFFVRLAVAQQLNAHTLQCELEGEHCNTLQELHNKLCTVIFSTSIILVS